MDKLKIQQHKSTFDAIVQFIRNESDKQAEVWFRRELQTVLGGGAKREVNEKQLIQWTRTKQQ
ncbi:MAG: hypothetical protein LBJ60_00100 [Tannerellaceae bacterium]|jgi:hypothetical protein|nr:hypothetical protein [Tannerellaceae bacterium]